MHTPHNHMPHTKREYAGEQEASPVVEWLNAAKIAPEARRNYARVLNILQQLLRLDPIADAWRPAYRRPDLMDHDDKYTKLMAEAYGIADRLNASLKHYRLAPQIEPRLGEGGVYVRWESASGSRGFSVMVCDLQGSPPFPVSEPRVIQKLLELSRKSCLKRIRACRECDRWFYAKFSHALFCSQQCQQKHFRTSETFKKHKREYMRDLRTKHKARSFRSPGSRPERSKTDGFTKAR
jgi:hypothetical protein